MIFWHGLAFWSGVTVGVVATVLVLGLTEPERAAAVREAQRVLHVERVRHG